MDDNTDVYPLGALSYREAKLLSRAVKLLRQKRVMALLTNNGQEWLLMIGVENGSKPAAGEHSNTDLRSQGS